jgi:hypothetical protein
MFSIIWRIALMICIAPFMLFPIVGWPLIPIQFYLAVSLAAHVWRRVNKPAQSPPESSV